ncbi:uncharacterized protein isoform X2 [Castor canadensis]|uniref:Uncharacterized protein isoform X2 n=1 Tax=Castor canadensis TaxID=51338 RepID=A0AC58KL22_CASCN
MKKRNTRPERQSVARRGAVQPHPAKWWARTAQLCVLIAPPGPSGGFMSPPVLQTPAEKAVPSASPLPLGFQASHQHALEATAAEGRKDSQVEKQPGLPPTHQQPLRTPAAVPGAGHRRLWWTHAIPAGARCSRRGAGSQYYSLEAGTETLPTGGRASSCQSPGSDAALPGHSRERRLTCNLFSVMYGLYETLYLLCLKHMIPVLHS